MASLWRLFPPWIFHPLRMVVAGWPRGSLPRSAAVAVLKSVARGYRTALADRLPSIRPLDRPDLSFASVDSMVMDAIYWFGVQGYEGKVADVWIDACRRSQSVLEIGGNVGLFTVIGGKVETSNSAAPEVDFSYFFTDNIALELIAATTRHTLYAKNSALAPNGSVNVGSTWVLPPTLLLQYHFMPKERFSPYIGAGLNVSFFYSSSPSGGAINQLAMSNNVGAAIQAGFDYNFSGHWFANFDVKQILVNTTASINGGAVKAKTALNPMVIGAGIGYRF